jgi:hypothetical protein
MRNTAEENRYSFRFATAMKGFYYLDDKQEEGKECTIINISFNGAGLEFYTPETINDKTKMSLEIFSPNGEEIVTVEGIIRWVKQGNKDCVCGIQLTEKLSKDKMKMLRM